MRSTTKTIVGLASIGLIAASYKFGLEAPAAFAGSPKLGGGITNPVSAAGSTSPTPSKTPTKGGDNTATGKSGNGSSASGSSSSGSSGSSAHSTGSAGSGSSGSSSSGSASSGSSGSGASSGAGASSGSGSSTGSGSSAGSGSSTGTSNTVTKMGNSIAYRYGTVQVQVTEVAGKVTDITLLKAGATGGRSAAFSYLVDYAIQAQGSNFGSLSGATYTTAAFVQSLDSALAQF